MTTKVFLKDILFGEILILEEYDFYDQPILFAGIDSVDQLYFVYLAVDDYDYEEWLMIPVSEKRLFSIRSGQIDILTAISSPEVQNLFLVQKKYGVESKTTIKEISAFEVNNDILPVKNIFIRTEEEFPRIKDIKKIEDNAISTNRLIVEVVYHPKDGYKHEIPAKLLGKTLTNFQSLSNHAAYFYQAKKPYKGGPLPSDILNLSTFNAIEITRSSFRIILGSREPTNLWGESSLVDPIKLVTDMINIGDEAEPLFKFFSAIEPSIVSKYYDFLDSIIDDGLEDIEVNWSTPNPKFYGKSRLPINIAIKIKQIINDTEDEKISEKEFFGTLIAASLRQLSCEIEDNEFKHRYECKDVRKSLIDGIPLGKTYKARIQVIKTYKPSKNEESFDYKLLSIEPIS